MADLIEVTHYFILNESQRTQSSLFFYHQCMWDIFLGIKEAIPNFI